MNSKTLPRLFGVSSIGKVKQWQISVEEINDGETCLLVKSGYVGGKIRFIPKIIKEGKNIGRSNETTPFEQALSEAESKWNKQRHGNYEPEMMDPDNYIPRIMLPMLAKAPGKGKIILPAYIQPKLNGICNLAENADDVLHHSRGGHFFETVPHLNEWIKMIDAPAPLHGELYKHGWSLQKIGSYTKDLKPDYDVLEYWIYDIAWLKVPFEERLAWMKSNILTLPHD